MKIELLVFALVILVVVQANPLQQVQQGFDFMRIFYSAFTAAGNILGTVVAAIATPILEVAATIEEKVVAPIQNKITSAGLGLAINSFCAMAPQMVKNFGFTVPSDAKEICITAAKEELAKGFDPKWTEPARV